MKISEESYVDRVRRRYAVNIEKKPERGYDAQQTHMLALADSQEQAKIEMLDEIHHMLREVMGRVHHHDPRGINVFSRAVLEAGAADLKLGREAGDSDEVIAGACYQAMRCAQAREAAEEPKP